LTGLIPTLPDHPPGHPDQGLVAMYSGKVVTTRTTPPPAEHPPGMVSRSRSGPAPLVGRCLPCSRRCDEPTSAARCDAASDRGFDESCASPDEDPGHCR